MAHGALSFVGRARELAELREGLAAAAAGLGGVWLVSGEPGIGKSQLTEELARGAGEFRVLWGRCWEAGGAPAYWPWIQVLRGLVRTVEGATAAVAVAARATYLVQLLPELGEQAAGLPDVPPLEPERARFQLLDAVAGALCDAAERAPLLVILEDLHAADASSMALFEFVAHQVRNARIALIGTFRPAEAEQGLAGPRLLRLSGEIRTIALAPLGRGEVAELLERALDRTPPAPLFDALYAISEGNPLFAGELVRLIVAHGASGVDPARPFATIPSGIKAAIAQRLGGLSAASRDALGLASVVGRELRSASLARALALPLDALERALDEAVDAAVLRATAPGEYRFSHIVVREVVYQGLSRERRSDLHLRIAETLAGAPPGEPPAWSEIAHHAFRAGDAGLALAAYASARAGDLALAQHAFDDAMASYRSALDSHDRSGGAPEGRIEILLRLSQAQQDAGDIDAGRDSCRVAADLARRLGAAELLAEAALQRGSVYVLAHVDPELVTLLEEALGALGERESALRARVMARLAAARQPALDHERPIALARVAIDMARRSGDDGALLAALSAGGSAMMDLVDAECRLPFDLEYMRLALSRGQPSEALRAYTRVMVDRFELADLEGAQGALAAARRIADDLGHPFYRWRSAALAATRAMWEGQLADAEDHIEEAHELGARGGDPNAQRAYVLQRMRLLVLQGRSVELAALAPRKRDLFCGLAAGALGAVSTCAQLYQAGAREPLCSPSPAELELLLALPDRTSYESLAEIAHLTGDRELARGVHERAAPVADRMLTSGVLGLTWEGPMRRSLALTALVAGRRDEAIDHFAAALERVRALGGRPMVAWLACEQAEARCARDPADPLARELADEAAAMAGDLGMRRVAARAEACRERLAEARPRPAAADLLATLPPRFGLRQEGDYWAVEVERRCFRIGDTKGMRLLAALVSEPGREFHVLELEGGPDARELASGDAGAMIDPRARDHYRRRVAALEEEIAQAEAWNDAGRAGRAREELAFLTAELSRAVGLGGRDRRVASAAERARVNVQRRIKDAVRRIGAHDAALARHLSRSIRTGAFCSYSP